MYTKIDSVGKTIKGASAMGFWDWFFGRRELTPEEQAVNIAREIPLDQWRYDGHSTLDYPSFSANHQNSVFRISMGNDYEETLLGWSMLVEVVILRLNEIWISSWNAEYCDGLVGHYFSLRKLHQQKLEEERGVKIREALHGTNR